jgi:DNA repair exonuclease SbcCD ATPase subunit
LQALLEEDRQEIAELKVKLQTIDRVCSNYAGFVHSGQDVCDKCGQKLSITEADLADRRKLRLEYETAHDEVSRKYLVNKKREEELGKLIQGWKDVSKEITFLKEQFRQYEKITFDEQDLLDYNTIIANYKSLVRDRHNLELSINGIANSIALLKRELSAVSIYDGKTTVEQEREEISTIIINNTEAQRKAQELKTGIDVKEAALTGINNRIKASEEGLEKNKKINDYVAMLHKLYDGFHTSQFPRQLILSYADIVTDYLQEKLDSFSIPYKVRVADNFKIEMIDDQDRVLPEVSGGQKMQVGLSLHIALHDLFSQSFPLMIIDEGTNALDKVNRAAYFDIIKNLKEKNKLKQILVIDHDPMLSEVVDQVIELKND